MDTPLEQQLQETIQASKMWHIDRLHEWSQNPRNITHDGFDRLKKQIESLGQYKPLLTMPDGTVLGGNMRIKALRDLGTQLVWISVIDFLQGEDGTWQASVNGAVQTKKFKTKEDGMMEYALSDNDRAGYYDADLLANMVPNFNVDWSEYAVDMQEPITIQSLLDGKKEIEEDEPPAVEDVAISLKGAIYQVGRHRVLCGDATQWDHVQALMGEQKADMIFTDPPYNVDYEGKTKDALKIENDAFSTPEAFRSFLLASFANMGAAAKDGAVFYVCHADTERVNFTAAFQEAGLKLAEVIIWVKQQFVMGRQDYQWQHEPILYGWKEGEAHFFIGDRNQTTVWNIDRPTQSLEHPTMKPLALVAKAVNNSSKSGDIVLDLFGGSGSTLMACEQANRTCYMMELDPRYVDVIRKRYAKSQNREADWEAATPQLS